jgi:hypothetical protein
MSDAKPQTRDKETQGTSQGTKNDSSQATKSRFEQFASTQAVRDMPGPTESTQLVSVDDNIDEIAHEALEEARRVEEAEKYRKTPGPVIPAK